MKKNILFMPSWYPTKENPLSGSFFKEQAELLTENFNFVILHYNESSISFYRYLYKIIMRNTIEYSFENKDSKLAELFFLSYKIAEIKLIGKILKKTGLSKKINHRLLCKANEKLKRILNDDLMFFPDVLYGVTAQVNAVGASYFAHFLNIPYIVAEHCPFPLPQTAISEETKNAIELADCVISISRDKTRQMLMQGLQFEPELVGNMIDEDKFSLYIKEKQNGVFTILIVAANNFYKDYPTFFRAMRQLRKLCDKPFKILIVGFNPITSKSIWNQGEDEFRKMVSDCGLLEICELVPRASREEMPDYYHRADVFVMTSIQEGFPVSSLEATACGLPVYATRCGGVEDFVDDEIGRIFNIQDYEKLADELKDLIEGKVSYDAEIIRKKTVENYGKKAFLTKMTKIFNRVIDDYARNNKK